MDQDTAKENKVSILAETNLLRRKIADTIPRQSGPQPDWHEIGIISCLESNLTKTASETEHGDVLLISQHSRGGGSEAGGHL